LKKKPTKKLGSASNELKPFLNHHVEVQFKTPIAMLANGQVMLGVSGFLKKVTTQHLHLGDSIAGDVTTLIDRDMVGVINKTLPEDIIFDKVPVPTDPDQGH
jgi:hypothetical protein